MASSPGRSVVATTTSSIRSAAETRLTTWSSTGRPASGIRTFPGSREDPIRACTTATLRIAKHFLHRGNHEVLLLLRHRGIDRQADRLGIIGFGIRAGALPKAELAIVRLPVDRDVVEIDADTGLSQIIKDRAMTAGSLSLVDPDDI